MGFICGNRGTEECKVFITYSDYIVFVYTCLGAFSAYLSPRVIVIALNYSLLEVNFFEKLPLNYIVSNEYDALSGLFSKVRWDHLSGSANAMMASAAVSLVRRW